MEQRPEKEYSGSCWTAVAALICVLAAVGFIPPQSLGGVTLRRANILSQLVSFDDGEAPAEQSEEPLFDEEEFRIDMAAVAEQLQAEQSAADTTQRSVPVTFEWNALPEGDTLARHPFAPRLRDSLRRVPAPPRVASLTPSEAYGTDSCFMRFCDTLLTAARAVRIAFLGDSFVEGDILTADLREALQETYGGGGAGFAPMASPLTGFRRTIKTQSKGWTSHNIMQRRNAPQHLRDNFFVSGWVCQPAAGASTRWECVGERACLEECTTARIFFLSPSDSRIVLTLNDSIRHDLFVEGDPAVRQAVVRAPRIGSLAFHLPEGSEGFVGYGALFEQDRGVTVDNYSIRSNNGQAMFWTNPSVDAQIGALAGGYDLIVLQYGLNIMQQGVHSYGNYAAQIGKMVAFVRECFPGAAVLVMGVSDRSARSDDGFRPMDAVPYMTDFQRRAAREAGAAFWPTSEAMRAEGGMTRFVQNGWAGKDYTHINYAGGRRVALALFDALNECLREAEARIVRIRREQQIVDSLRRSLLDRRLFSP
ncbi:MAG: hypothetical protein K2N93_02425, partial [Alistipes sp.]|nr:hypothetical protein [Alistipes sp.]